MNLDRQLSVLTISSADAVFGLSKNFWSTLFESLYLPSWEQYCGRPWYDNDQFQATIDVQDFKPEDIDIRVDDNVITVEGKHEEAREKQDEYRRERNAAYKHFLKRYYLPYEYDNNRVESRLSSDGFLTVTAPKKGVWVPWKISTDRRIPISYGSRTYTSRPWLKKLSWK
ncbi:unnamed protein product [Acanthoscelides obtectus]|uniref:SHSP domain-containing protein n=1 Tax=Acanthoscelides obtectus TaxID=200917 RepID=A0A9P0MK96_ACAOB|nr:unnamed protein product [Acanthoscelides obtectus]CAK1630342.1 Protein lethal(2)essential for life [Acanthoscelides obtectus]